MVDLRTDITGGEPTAGVHATLHNDANSKINDLVNAPDDVVLTSPNQTKYLLVVDNDGVLGTEVVVP